MSRYTESEEEKRERVAREDLRAFLAALSPSERVRMFYMFKELVEQWRRKAKAANV